MRGQREPSPVRREVLRVMALTTLVFALLAGGLVWAARTVPELRLRRIESALDAGDTLRARSLIRRVEDEDLAREYTLRCDYLDAEAALEKGDAETALGLFAALGSYADAAERVRECLYRQGEALAAREDWEGAETLFREAGQYADAPARTKEMRYRHAAALAAEGRTGESFLLFTALGDYEDAAAKALALATELTGEPDLEKAAAVARSLTPEEMERRAALSRAREALPRDVLDVGFFHTVGLRADGTVLACGDDAFGQCDVSAWRDIVAVACGAYHTVGLRSDGTVVAAGRDTEGQCAVGSWQGVTQIAAGDYATFARLADGTVACCGFNDYYMLPDWGGVERIFAGSYDVGALRGGEALISHISARSEELTDLVDLALNTGFAVGLRPDGTVVSPRTALPDWEDVIALSASGTAILALTREGRVLSRFFREGDRIDFSSLEDVRAMAAGGTHFAFLLSDGTVRVLGETDRGQGDTADWRLTDG